MLTVLVQKLNAASAASRILNFGCGHKLRYEF
jgi:hypothetical protein